MYVFYFFASPKWMLIMTLEKKKISVEVHSLENLDHLCKAKLRDVACP